MLLGDLIRTSDAVAQTRSRLAKAGHLAQVLVRLDAAEVPIGVAYLSGEVRQPKLGIGYATLASARAPAAAEATLQLTEVDAALEAVSRVSGAGSAAKKQSQLQALFAR